MNQKHIDVINTCLAIVGAWGNETSKSDIKEAKEAFRSMAEKQTPCPPEYKIHPEYPVLGKDYFCKCGVLFIDYERNGTNYCGACGQKLKEESE